MAKNCKSLHMNSRSLKGDLNLQKNAGGEPEQEQHALERHCKIKDQ